ncbi:MAG: HipA domain-containing protein, partial [Candidatus Adiutrix sp.]|jgi:serine/threonine-protein kinase HipA|nr:HipA domain-containing protein [Candidatus Adiutrix sp.]
LRAKGIEYGSLTVAEKLALIGSSGRGSLEYFPQCVIDGGLPEGEPAILAEEVRAILQGRFNGDVGKGARLSGASGGARPKVHICHEGREWIVKFGDSHDSEAVGKMEYQYALTAAKAGLQMPETELVEGRYFGVRRFDRDGDGNRLLMLSAAGLLCGEQGFMLLDYKDLLAATLDLTGDLSEVEKMFRLMCFNVLAKNCDDHARNFAFLRGGDGRWRVAPGFDLTYAPCLFGRQATTVAGKYAEIGLPEVLEAASGLNLDPAAARLVWEQVKTAVEEDRLVYLARDTLASREAPGSEA